jgi:hypothetical protein
MDVAAFRRYLRAQAPSPEEEELLAAPLTKRKAFETKERHMIVDLRTYRIKPGKMPHELDLYAKRGLAPQTRHLGPPLA